MNFYTRLEGLDKNSQLLESLTSTARPSPSCLQAVAVGRTSQQLSEEKTFPDVVYFPPPWRTTRACSKPNPLRQRTAIRCIKPDTRRTNINLPAVITAGSRAAQAADIPSTSQALAASTLPVSVQRRAAALPQRRARRQQPQKL